MNENLYHTAIYLPEVLNRVCVSMNLRLRWTKHALAQAANDRYGYLPSTGLPAGCCVRDWQLIEVAALGDKVQKIVVRTRYSDRADLCLVLGFRGEQPGNAAVVTCWFNQNGDTHKSLDRSKYVPAPVSK